MANSRGHCLGIFLFVIAFSSSTPLGFDKFSIIDSLSSRKHLEDDYWPPRDTSPATCEDLNGVGSLNTTCELNSSLNLTADVYAVGTGNLRVLPGVTLSCLTPGCSLVVDIGGSFELSANARIVAGSVFVRAADVTLLGGSVINVTGLAGDPPDPKGTPQDADGGGGGHGGRGASCLVDNKKLREDIYGGDAYSWGSMQEPWSYGSKGGSTSRDRDYGGLGGGRIWFEVNGTLNFQGLLQADGGDGGVQGGGGSAGSVYIKSNKM